VKEDRGGHGLEKRLGGRFQILKSNEDVNMRCDGCGGPSRKLKGLVKKVKS